MTAPRQGTPGPESKPVVTIQQEDLLGDAQISRVVELVHHHAGIALQPRNRRTIQSAIAKRAFRLGLDSAAAYLARIERTGDDELQELVSMLTVQKTSFFRDRPQFDLLERMVVPELLSRRLDIRAPVRAWSAGCSTGEEAYTIAAVLRRSVPADIDVQVLATDISMPALAHAMEGRYREADRAPLRADERGLLLPDGGSWTVRRDLRTLVDFRFHNLVSLPFPTPGEGPWDVIFCRNVLIYFSRETIRETIRRFHDVLVPGGYLFLGSSESLFQLAEDFDLENRDDAFVYRKAGVHIPTIRDRRGVRSRSPAVSPHESGPIPSTSPASHGSPLPELRRGITEAKRMLRQDDPDAAFQRLFGLTGQFPRELEPYMMLGRLAADRGSLEEALSWYQVATEVQPLDLEARFLLAVILHRVGHDFEAAEELRKLLFLDGDFVLGHYYLGVIADRLGDIGTSLRSFRNTVRTSHSGPSRASRDMLDKHQLTLEALVVASRARLSQLGQEANEKESPDQ